MTMNNPLNTLAQFSPNAQNVMGSTQAGGNVLTRGLINEQQQMTNESLRSQQNIQNTVLRLQEMERLIGTGADESQLMATLQGYEQDSLRRGANPIDTRQAMQALQQGGIQGLQNVLGQAKSIFQQQGIMAAPAQPKGMGDAFAKLDPSKFTRESVAAFEQSGRFSDLIPISPEAVDPEYLKELRGELRRDVGSLQDQALDLRTNFNKLNNLADEMRKGNRSAVAQGLVSLVKLGDPGSVVKEEELRQALGAESPTAAVASLLRDKGTSTNVINSVIQSFDPLNPDAVNVDQILATGQAMLQPNIDTITSAYGVAKDRAASQLSAGGLTSIFDPSRDKLFSDIAGLKFNYAAPTEMATTQQNQQVTQQPQGISVPGLESLSDGTMVQGPDGRTYTIRGGMAYPQ